MNTSRTRLVTAIVGGSAILAVGALTDALHDEQTAGGAASVYQANRGEMTLGNSATTTEPEPTVLATAKAVPAVKAPPFGEG